MGQRSLSSYFHSAKRLPIWKSLISWSFVVEDVGDPVAAELAREGEIGHVLRLDPVVVAGTDHERVLASRGRRSPRTWPPKRERVVASSAFFQRVLVQARLERRRTRNSRSSPSTVTSSSHCKSETFHSFFGSNLPACSRTSRWCEVRESLADGDLLHRESAVHGLVVGHRVEGIAAAQLNTHPHPVGDVCVDPGPYPQALPLTEVVVGRSLRPRNPRSAAADHP